MIQKQYLIKCLENLEKIRWTNGLNPASLSVDKKKSVTRSAGKSSKNHKGSNMWCHYCDKNNHNTADCRAISKFKQHKKNKACFEARAGPGKKSLAFFSKKFMHLKGSWSLKRLQAARRGRLNPSSQLKSMNQFNH
jgi:hypothetical protein